VLRRLDSDTSELTSGVRRAHTLVMRQRHHVLLARLALGLLALVAELLGRSLTHRIDIGRHVAAPSYSGADYYPILLIVVKAGVALMLARLVWRFARARATARAARRLLRAQGQVSGRRAPRMRIEISPRLWLAAFLVTSVFFLIQRDAEEISSGRWPLLAPWLHTSALPVFAVLAVLVALLYGAVARWLTDYELYARETAAHAARLCLDAPVAPRAAALAPIPPRTLFGLAFESRPPPAPA
jgi:hypothetical protein